MYGTDFLACSKWAAEWMYTDNMNKEGKVQVINNGIEIEKFSYDENIRNEYKSMLNIEDDTKAICHIGRFNDQKNHTFLIDIFNELHGKDKRCKLFLIGDGELKNKIIEKVNMLNLEKYVCFLGDFFSLQS